MIIDARKQFEKEPKSFGQKRNRITDAHRQWIEERYRDGWKQGYTDEHVKLFQNNGHRKDFAYHKVSVVFWQTDENEEPGVVTERYEKSFTAANIVKEQAFYSAQPVLLGVRRQAKRDAALDTQLTRGATTIQSAAVVGALQNGSLHFKVDLTDPMSGRRENVTFTLAPDDSFSQVFEKAVREAFATEIEGRTKKLAKASDRNKAVKGFIYSLLADVEWTHRHYVKDDEYIPYGEDIGAFLEREIAKPIICWQENERLGYEILPNKYFYRYQPPTPATDLLTQFWKLEKEAENMLRQLGARA